MFESPTENSEKNTLQKEGQKDCKNQRPKTPDARWCSPELQDKYIHEITTIWLPE